MWQRWQAVGNTGPDLTGPRFKPRTSRSRDERVAARPTGRGQFMKWMKFLLEHTFALLFHAQNNIL